MISDMSFFSDYFSDKKAKPKRNYIKENIKRLEQISKARQCGVAPTKSASASRFHRPLSEISDQSGTGYNCRREGSNLSLNQLKLKDFKDVHHPAGFRHQSSQTIAEKDLDSLYHDGVIRFPTKQTAANEHRHHTKMVRTISLQTETPPADCRSLSPMISGSPGGDSVKDFVKMNAQVQVNTPKRRLTTPDPNLPPPNYQVGVLPRYLREQRKDHNRLKDLIPHEECPPPGHVILPEEERVKHLNELKQRYTELCVQLNSLPVKADTLRVRHKRMDIEKELEKVDAGIKLFSRDKLYIQV